MAKKAQMDEVRPVLDAVNKVADKVEDVLDAVDKGADVATSAVDSGLEKVADVVPDALDAGVHISTEGGRKLVRFMRSPRNMLLVMSLGGAAVGAALGIVAYRLQKRHIEAKLRAEYDERFEEEIAEVREHYARLTKSGAFSSPETAAEELLTREAATALRNYGNQTVKLPGAPVVDIRVDEVTDAEGSDDPDHEERNDVSLTELRERMRHGPVSIEERGSNIFVDGHPLTGEEEWDQEEVDRARAFGEPHIITHEEFMENPDGWATNTLTYFNGDDTLVDDQEIPVDNIEETVGSENLSRFGQGSRDRNVVYVRNPKVEVLFEIVLHTGEYAKEVAGFKHSAPNRVLRFRDRDE